MSKESERARMAYLGKCQGEFGQEVKCLKKKQSTYNPDSSLGMAKVAIEAIPQLKGRLYIEGENSPATKELPNCDGCKDDGYVFPRVDEGE